MTPTDRTELRRLALQTKPLVDGSTRSLNAFYHAASPDVVLALLDELHTAHMDGYEGGKQEARDAAHAEVDALRTLITKLHAAKGRYHSQIAACDLFDAVGLKNERPVK